MQPTEPELLPMLSLPLLLLLLLLLLLSLPPKLLPVLGLGEGEPCIPIPALVPASKPVLEPEPALEPPSNRCC
jgi:hypothetical protein